MWRIVTIVLLSVVSLSQTRPSYLPTATAILPTYEHHVEYAPTIIGHTALSLPTAVSHQSQTIIHEKRPYLRPIIEHAPIVQTAYPISTHIVNTPILPATSIGIPTIYPDLSYAKYYNHHGWSSSLSSPWIK